jgi:hypothetical protein
MYVPGGAVSRLSAAVITFTVGGTAATGQYQPLELPVAVAASQRGKATMKCHELASHHESPPPRWPWHWPVAQRWPRQAQLTAAGWTCIQPHLFPALLLCAPPGVGLPPLPGTPGFAGRAPSYEFLVFLTEMSDPPPSRHSP